MSCAKSELVYRVEGSRVQQLRNLEYSVGGTWQLEVPGGGAWPLRWLEGLTVTAIATTTSSTIANTIVTAISLTLLVTITPSTSPTISTCSKFSAADVTHCLPQPQLPALLLQPQLSSPLPLQGQHCQCVAKTRSKNFRILTERSFHSVDAHELLSSFFCREPHSPTVNPLVATL